MRGKKTVGIRRKALDATEFPPTFLLASFYYTAHCSYPYVCVSHFFGVKDVPWTTFLPSTLVLESFS